MCSTLISLYTFYLFAFRMYEVSKGKKTNKRVLLPNIVYLLTFISSFCPIWNLLLSSGFYFAVFMNDKEDFVVDSWLFKKPGQKSE